jgi:hypothetical protein
VVKEWEMARKSDVKLVQGIGKQSGELIHLVVFLECAIASEVLHAAYLKLLKIGKGKQTAYATALYEGYWALRQKAGEQANFLKNRGQLLFAFPGTTVLQGGAA